MKKKKEQEGPSGDSVCGYMALVLLFAFIIIAEAQFAGWEKCTAILRQENVARAAGTSLARDEIKFLEEEIELFAAAVDEVDAMLKAHEATIHYGRPLRREQKNDTKRVGRYHTHKGYYKK